MEYFDHIKAPIIGLPLHDRIIGAMEGSDDGHTYFFTSRYSVFTSWT